MAESGNKIVSESSEELTVDPWKAVGQHLQALARAGALNLPKGHGRHQFHLPQTVAPEAMAEPTKVSQKRTARPPNQPESKSEMKGSGPSNVAESTGSYQSRPAIPVQSSVVAGAYGPSLSMADRESTLSVIRTEVEACTRCPELCHSRKQTVFGVGRLNPRLVFVGEGPGADEDRVGEPFVGAAGQKLNKIIAACKMERSDVYILNTVKCRPPANRNPSQDELDQCWEYAERQLEVLQPEFICCLGSVAAKRVLNTTESLGRLRQKFYSYRGSQVLVTYHPAYLLRTESANRLVWEDMKLLMKEMGIAY